MRDLLRSLPTHFTLDTNMEVAIQFSRADV